MKNYNVLFLIRDILIRLYYIKIYNKFDIIIVFNDIYIRFNNERKIVFIIKYN